MSRLTSDRNLQQSQQQQNSQNQQIQQVVRIPATPQQQLLSLPQSGSLIIGSTNNNSNNDAQRTPLNTINPINSIYYTTPPSTATTASTSTNVGVNNPACANISTPTTHLDSTSPVAKKRLKLEVDCITSATEDLSAIKKRILEHKHQRLKASKERHTEHVAELFFLQSSGNMMEYPAWRKKPAVPQFVNFKKNYRLDQTLAEDGDLLRALNQQNQPEGAEIKIPGVGSTPIAISKQLPAAVAQLSQKGQIPGKPQGGRHGMIFGQLSSSSSSIGNSPQKPLVPGGTPLVLSEQKRLHSLGSIIGSTNGSATPSNYNQNASTSAALSQQQYNSNDQFSVKAKEEASILQRVQELKREGLWMGARLPKLVEPTRKKVHWDFLVEEMQWLSADFANERKWKKAAAKKLSKAIQKYFLDKELAAQKAQKAQEQNLKRIAAFMAREVKTFWTSIKKVVEDKQQKRLEAKRQVAFNEQLKLMVDQTEQFSKQVAKGMTKKTSVTTSLNSSRISSPLPRNASDDEWSRPNEDSDDDEETIAREEKEIPESSTKEEIDALEREGQMDIDDLLRDYLLNRDKIVVPESDSEQSDSEKETEKRKKTEQNLDHKASSSKAESEMSVDEPRAKRTKENSYNEEELDSDDESIASEVSSDEEMEVDSDEEESDVESVDEVKTTEDVGLKNLLEDQQSSGADNCDNGDALLNSVAALAQSIQPKGNTLTSTDVVTPIPILLKHTLREYQHIGLDWLVTMHDRKLNGILADEMGLGKTIQTIALLAHLACVRGNWGPHLIIVPSSVMLNWEMEFKKWCPGFKILTYYGSQKERKLKRIGWTKPNAFHVCITSYKLVIQDHQSFRRKKWKYLILDEAQNIKNFKSQRWQLLLNFVTEQRLLLTGTPLQNNMMELWSLMHFLMPNFFESHRTFEELFSKPMTGMVEGNLEYNETIIMKLHKVLRPFLLRRLKCEVEKQMPKKYEHVVMCRLSKRQRFLYDDFMSRAKTKESLASGNMLSVINVLMQLRKVCNHPNLFEVRPTVSPFRMEQIDMKVPAMLTNIFQYDPLENIDLVALNLVLLHFETYLTGFVAHRMKNLAAPRKLIEEIDSSPELPPTIPKGKCKLFYRVKPEAHKQLSSNNQYPVGTSPMLRADGTRVERKNNISAAMVVDDDKPTTSTQIQIPSTSGMRTKSTHQLIQSSLGQFYLVNNKQGIITKSPAQMVIVNSQHASNVTQPLATACIDAVRNANQAAAIVSAEDKEKKNSEFHLADIEEAKRNYRLHLLQLLSKSNVRKVEAQPLYGEDLINVFTQRFENAIQLEKLPFTTRSAVICSDLKIREDWSLSKVIKTNEQRAEELKEIFEKFVLFVPAVTAKLPSISVTHMHPSQKNEEIVRIQTVQQELAPKSNLLHPIASAMTTQFPDPRLIQYDCGKLQSLDGLLRRLKSETHRVLIFTQMTKMLDVLEAFLNYHGHIYLRLDGTTKVEQRQLLMERFNEDRRIFAFILSTRSGGVGINLTGADTVIFYDSDWNPTCDAQAQDRCHRIGQTRDVHIYRLISERTIEENILKKANQKRLLGDLAIEGGNFTEAFFRNSSTIQDLFDVDQSDDASTRLAEVVDRDKDRRERLTQSFENKEFDKGTLGAFESALAQAEDEQDVQAAKTATAEIAQDLDEFDENIPITEDKESELTKQEKDLLDFIKQLNPIEQYAIRFVEDTGADLAAERLKAVDEEIEKQKHEWEKKQLALKQEEELERQRTEREDNEILTYSRKDALNKIWLSMNNMEVMPMWCPPTPPQDGNDIYIDYSLSLLYDTQAVMNENDLPAVYVKKDYKRMRTDDGFYIDRRHLKMRKDDGYNPPRSLFDRPSPALAKMRKDLKQQRNRGLMRAMPMANIKQQIQPKPLIEPEGMAEWTIFEDRAILSVIQNLQGLPMNLILISPGHTANWDLVADIVNQNSRTYRSPKHCRWRYEAVIVPREEGKLIDSPKKQKKTKNLLKTSMKNSRSPRTAQLYNMDNNNSFIKLTKMKIDTIKAVMMKKPPPLKKYVNNTPLNQKHLQVLSDLGIASYEMPQSPLDIAQRCYERLLQGRSIQEQKMDIQQSQTQPSPSIQQTTQPQINPLQQATIVVQQPGLVASGASGQTVQSGQQQIALVHQGQRIQQTINISPAQPNSQQHQIMKAIVASPSGGHQQATLLTGIIQQINPQQMQNTQSNLIQTSSVSVVLTSPPTTTVTSVQPQIVSIQPTVATSTPIVSLPGSIVHTQSGQGQIVSVAQLGSTSLTAQASTIGGQQQIRQRTVPKEVVFQNRQGPQVFSLSGINAQGLSHLRFASNINPSNLRAATTGEKQQIVTQQGKRFEIVQTPQFQITTLPPQPGQNQVRQKLRLLHTGPFTQAGTAQTNLVPSSGVGQTMQVPGGQKITVATINPTAAQSGVSTSQTTFAESIDSSQTTQSGLTVQVAPQQRTQFIKQVGSVQTIGQSPNQKLVMVKHDLPQQYKTGQLQLTAQTQLAYTPTGNIQLQPSSSGQQITTLIKTSTAQGITTVAGGTPVGMKLTPVRANLAQGSAVRQVAIPQTVTMGIQGTRKATPKVTRIAQVGSRGGFVFQEMKPIKGNSNQIYISNPNAIPAVSQASNSQSLQFVTPTSRGIPAGNIRIQQAIKMIPSDNQPQQISLHLGQRRQQTVSLQKTMTGTTQQVTIDATTSVSPGTQQGQISTSPNASAQQNVAQQPQHSPQQK